MGNDGTTPITIQVNGTLQKFLFPINEIPHAP